MKLFTTEQVSKWHPDKYADQISDAIVDALIKEDPNARVAVETLVKGETVVVAGEVSPQVHNDYIIRQAVNKVANKLGYQATDIINLIGRQSSEIAKAVNQGEEIGAGDQGMMFGYATIESQSLLPWGFDLANRVISIIEDDVDFNPASPLKGDAKVQVTVDFEAESIETSLHTLLISVCHKEQYSLREIKDYVSNLILKNDIPLPNHNLLINPAGEWTIGGPIADAGLTGRKIVADQYGGYVPVGGGAFSGKDPSKVDRSASYMARHLAVQAIYKYAEEGLEWIQVQLAYAIGIAEPVSVAIATNLRPGNELLQEVEQWINSQDLTPKAIIEALQLNKNTDYERRAEGCHYYLHEPQKPE